MTTETELNFNEQFKEEPLTLQQQLSVITNKSSELANIFANKFFYGLSKCRANKDDRKKISHDKVKEIAHQALCQGQILTLETLFAFVKVIILDKDYSDKQKVELIFGDIELLIQAHAKYFSKNWDMSKSMGGCSIEELRQRYNIKPEMFH